MLWLQKSQPPPKDTMKWEQICMTSKGLLSCQIYASLTLSLVIETTLTLGYFRFVLEAPTEEKTSQIPAPSLLGVTMIALTFGVCYAIRERK